MNNQTKQNIRAKVETYIKRAEEIKKMPKNGPVKKKALADDAADRGNSRDNKRNEDDSGDIDKKRIKQKFEGIFLHFIDSCMSYIIGAIVTDPNVSFSDVVGLDQAKEALKEAVILPVKFPQLFQGIAHS